MIKLSIYNKSALEKSMLTGGFYLDIKSFTIFRGMLCLLSIRNLYIAFSARLIIYLINIPYLLCKNL